MGPDFRQDDEGLDPAPGNKQHRGMAREPCVYIMASRRHGTIYTGVTSDLAARIYRHRTGAFKGFTSEHHVLRLVHFEMFADMDAAITGEKRLKNWRRDWKVALIEAGNPLWADRALELGFDPLPPHPATLKVGREVGS